MEELTNVQKIKLLKRFTKMNPNLVNGTRYFEVKEHDLDFLFEQSEKYEELKEAYSQLLISYEATAETVIAEFSGEIDKETESLKAEIDRYKSIIE